LKCDVTHCSVPLSASAFAPKKPAPMHGGKCECVGFEMSGRNSGYGR